MEFLWSPWRYDYMASVGKAPSACVFCVGENADNDAGKLIIHRGIENFVILNLFPYNNAHLLIVPRVSEPSEKIGTSPPI